ncbi:MAG: RNA-directed DNA polymerase [Ruminococcaceae bacterium]|nr:RNA-directed DNA polymerase [Oscillospiraceae bacterium]
MTDFEKVTDFHNMYRAFRKAKCGKGNKKSAARFNLVALDGVNTLIAQLKDKTYRVSGYAEFKVYEPKERIIQTSSFKDKVVQHSLCDNVLLPRLQKIFIHDNCAGQKGKGTLFGLDRLSEQMQAFYSRYGMEGYILKCDVRKFFYSISHEQLKDIVHYHFGYDPDICWLCDLFIDSTEGKGVPLGNQISQAFGLIYLDGMDKLIVHQLGIEYYGRYVDDFWLIHPSKAYLQHCLEVITAYLETLDLELNEKTQIFPFKNGVSYLGFHTYITADGTPIRKLSNQKKRNAQKKYTRMAKLVVAGKLPQEKLDHSYAAHQNHRSHGNCYHLGKTMDLKINQILGGNNNGVLL